MIISSSHFFLKRVPKGFDHPLHEEWYIDDVNEDVDQIDLVPKGEYFQAWESISNSPISPPFASKNDLFSYLLEHQKEWGYNFTQEEWEESLKANIPIYLDEF